jgi:copper homeostasis protein
MTLEVIVQSLPDALAAAAGGADRLEVLRDICAGGLTPSVDLVRQIQNEIPLPLRIMVRARDGLRLEPNDVGALRDAVAEFMSLRVDGLVIGFLREGMPDVEALSRVVGAPGPVQITFHRAFDAVKDPLAAIDRLLGVPQMDRILTSAGEADPAFVRCERLHAYARRAAGRIAIIAGGGIDEYVLGIIAKTGCVREVHVGRAAREGNDPAAPVSADRVKRLRELSQ